MSDVPLTIDSVTVKLDGEVSRPGDQGYAIAIVEGTSDNKDVTWALTGNLSDKTTLKQETFGWLLRVAEDETSTKLTITATSVFDPTKSGSLDINLTPTTPIAGAEVTGIEETYVYTGSKIEPVPTVKLGGVILTAGTDYTVEYINVINAGQGDVRITGIGSYSGKIDVMFTIEPIKVPIPKGKWLIYNGLEQTGVEANDTYYTITGNTATAIGEYTATLTLKNKPNYVWSDGTSADLSINWAIVSDATPEPTTPAPGETTPAPGTTTPAPGTTTPAPDAPTPTPTPVALQKVELSVSKSDLYMKRSGGGYLQLELKLTPANADINSVTWTSDAPKKAKVDESGLVTAVKKGKAVITVTVTDA